MIKTFKGTIADDGQDKIRLSTKKGKIGYRIIHFFHLQRMFDFSHIKTYLEENLDEWLIDVPLVSLKNPDIYFCGIYLAKQLEVKLEKEKIKEFLSNMFEEATDRYESPIIEATDGSYYYFKSTELMK